MPRWDALDRRIVGPDDPTPKIMGIVNVTPDSFSDGGRFDRVEAARTHADRLAADGADLLDVGGESSRPGAEPVPLDDELRRVVPAIESIAATHPGLPISVDTVKAEVARRAVAAGACIINDIIALTADPAMLRVAADTGAGVVLMHMIGTPQTMQDDPRYADVVTEVYDHLARRIEAVAAAGIPRERIAVDPGIGFGKTNAHSLELLRNLDRFVTLGCTLLIGTSRKGFLGKLTGRSIDERATASAVSALAAATLGARVLRVHDVGATSDAIKVWSAQVGWTPEP